MANTRDNDLPAAADARLDALLEQWALANTLPTAQAAAIRERVLAADETVRTGLDVAWWQGLAASVKQSMAQPAAVLRGLGWGMGWALGNGTLIAQTGR